MLKCGRCGQIFDETEGITRSELVDSGPGYKHYEHYYTCPNCDSDEIEEFDFPYDECGAEYDSGDCPFCCERCELADRKENEE